MSAALDFTYRYAASSGVAPAGGKPRLALATCDASLAHPHFFDGRARHPRQLGEMLHTLSDVVRTHFFQPRPALLDPVLTSNEALLRLEGFSGCCGVYARVDLPAEGFDGGHQARGTTNVDFNAPMRNMLLRLRDGEDVRFAVGHDGVTLEKGAERAVEKKVKLPLRWIKGFSEAQAYQSRLQLRLEAPAAEALAFVRGLPRSGPKLPSYAVPAGRGIRLSQRQQPGAVRFHGTHRVKVIEPLLARARSLRVWADDAGASAWEVRYDVGAFTLMLSPELFRGFSGEGQALEALAKPPPEAVVAAVRAGLRWRSDLEARALAAELGLGLTDVAGALAVLGTRGLAGFDAANGRYFHRELPFDLARVEEMQPRLGGARALVEAGAVRRLPGAEPIYAVDGTGTTHRVALREDRQTCTCPWFSKHGGERGPCKHVLAAGLFAEDAA